jgi:hypothetical protein
MTGQPSSRWIVLAAAFVIITMSIGTLFALGVLLKPMEDAYRSDRFGTRVVVLVGGAMLGAGLVLSSQVTQPAHLYVTFGALVGGGVSWLLRPAHRDRGQ